MKRAILVTSVASMIKQFNMSNIKILQELDYEVTVATNFEDAGNIPIDESNKLYDNLREIGVKPINIDFHRNPLNRKNIKAYRQFKTIIDSNYYDLIHCQSPIGGVLGRIAAQDTRKKGTKIIYTAHGFHFYNGAPLVNWVTFFPVEKVLSRYTDLLITINNEDYNRAVKLLHATSVKRIPGVGIDVQKFSSKNICIDKKREELKIPKNCYLILSVGELNNNKNHRILIEALNEIKNPHIHYAIAGTGSLSKKLMELTYNSGLTDNIHFLGYRDDIADIYSISNVFAFPSKREGLGLSAIEAMASGLPIITSNVHGILDYSVNGETGFIFSPDNVNEAKEAIEKVYKLSDQEVKYISENNKKKSEKYNQSIVNEQMKLIYESITME